MYIGPRGVAFFVQPLLKGDLYMATAKKKAAKKAPAKKPVKKKASKKKSSSKKK